MQQSVKLQENNHWMEIGISMNWNCWGYFQFKVGNAFQRHLQQHLLYQLSIDCDSPGTGPGKWSDRTSQLHWASDAPSQPKTRVISSWTSNACFTILGGQLSMALRRTHRTIQMLISVACKHKADSNPPYLVWKYTKKQAMNSNLSQSVVLKTAGYDCLSLHGDRRPATLPPLTLPFILQRVHDTLLPTASAEVNGYIWWQWWWWWWWWQ